MPPPPCSARPAGSPPRTPTGPSGRSSTRTTLDGVEVSPLGTPALTAGLEANARPVHPGGRDVRVELRGDDAEQLNAEALADLAGGATSMWLHAGPDTDLAAVLDGVLLDLAPVVLDATAAPVDLAQKFLAHLADTTPAPGTNLGAPADAADDDLVAVAGLAIEAGVLAVVVDASTIHDRGASEAQELGWSMAAAARVLRVLEGAGIDVEQAAGLMEFRYAATDEQFLTIAKLRAARLLWTRVLDLSDAGAVPQRQHAVTSRPMMSRYDPWVNMLRTTVAAFSATVGGADAVTVQPFDRPLGRPDAFGRRIARNQMALLLQESHVGRVADPAGGAWAVERLTHDLAEAGWAFLQELDGGASLDDAVAATVDAARTRGGHPPPPAHRAHRVPEPRRDPARSRRRARRRTPLRRRLRGTARRARRDAGLPGHARTGRRAHRASDVRDQPVRRRWHRGQHRVPRRPGSGVPGRHRRGVRRVGCRDGRGTAPEGAQRVIVAGRPRDWADDSCAVGVDALAFLQRTREALA